MIPDAVVTDADMRAADAFLDGLATALPDTMGHLKPGPYGHARGALAAFLASVRAAGYLEGVQEGRREAAAVVLETLRDEGLAP